MFTWAICSCFVWFQSTKGISSLIFYLQAKEPGFSLCFDRFWDFNSIGYRHPLHKQQQVNERQINRVDKGGKRGQCQQTPKGTQPNRQMVESGERSSPLKQSFEKAV